MNEYQEFWGDLNLFCDAMRWAADSDQVGYSQNDRDSLRPEDFFGDGLYNTDCSKLGIVALNHAGFDTAWASYSGNLSSALTSRGWLRLPFVWWDDIRPGDILLSDANHVAVWIGDCVSQASIDENGNIVNGARGDQTGWEVNTCGLYDYPWDCILRCPVWEVEPERRDKVQYINNNGGDVYRLYNEHTGYHHFTCDANERDGLIELGWTYEGVAWKAPTGGIHPAYRMYNPNNGDHAYTIDFVEAQTAEEDGWLYEGVSFFSNDDGTPVYRLYNQNSGEHFYTANKDEFDKCIADGWTNEGVAFYAE